MYFFNPPEPTLNKGDMEAYSKAKAASEKVFKRNGWRSIYGRLVESGFFTVSTMPPIAAAVSADFRDAAILISQENAQTT